MNEQQLELPFREITDLRPLVRVLFDSAETALGCFSSQWATAEDKADALEELRQAVYISRAVGGAWGDGRTVPLAAVLRWWWNEHTRLLRILGQQTREYVKDGRGVPAGN